MKTLFLKLHFLQQCCLIALRSSAFIFGDRPLCRARATVLFAEARTTGTTQFPGDDDLQTAQPQAPDPGTTTSDHLATYLDQFGPPDGMLEKYFENVRLRSSVPWENTLNRWPLHVADLSWEDGQGVWAKFVERVGSHFLSPRRSAAERLQEIDSWFIEEDRSFVAGAADGSPENVGARTANMVDAAGDEDSSEAEPSLWHFLPANFFADGKDENGLPLRAVLRDALGPLLDDHEEEPTLEDFKEKVPKRIRLLLPWEVLERILFLGRLRRVFHRYLGKDEGFLLSCREFWLHHVKTLKTNTSVHVDGLAQGTRSIEQWMDSLHEGRPPPATSQGDPRGIQKQRYFLALNLAAIEDELSAARLAEENLAQDWLMTDDEEDSSEVSLSEEEEASFQEYASTVDALATRSEFAVRLGRIVSASEQVVAQPAQQAGINNSSGGPSSGPPASVVQPPTLEEFLDVLAKHPPQFLQPPKWQRAFWFFLFGLQMPGGQQLLPPQFAFGDVAGWAHRQLKKLAPWLTHNVKKNFNQSSAAPSSGTSSGAPPPAPPPPFGPARYILAVVKLLHVFLREVTAAPPLLALRQRLRDDPDVPKLLKYVGKHRVFHDCFRHFRYATRDGMLRAGGGVATKTDFRSFFQNILRSHYLDVADLRRKQHKRDRDAENFDTAAAFWGNLLWVLICVTAVLALGNIAAVVYLRCSWVRKRKEAAAAKAADRAAWSLTPPRPDVAGEYGKSSYEDGKRSERSSCGYSSSPTFASHLADDSIKIIQVGNNRSAAELNPAAAPTAVGTEFCPGAVVASQNLLPDDTDTKVEFSGPTAATTPLLVSENKDEDASQLLCPAGAATPNANDGIMSATAFVFVDQPEINPPLLSTTASDCSSSAGRQTTPSPSASVPVLLTCTSASGVVATAPREEGWNCVYSDEGEDHWQENHLLPPLQQSTMFSATQGAAPNVEAVDHDNKHKQTQELLHKNAASGASQHDFYPLDMGPPIVLNDHHAFLGYNSNAPPPARVVKDAAGAAHQHPLLDYWHNEFYLQRGRTNRSESDNSKPSCSTVGHVVGAHDHVLSPHPHLVNKSATNHVETAGTGQNHVYTAPSQINKVAPLQHHHFADPAIGRFCMKKQPTLEQIQEEPTDVENEQP
ncbi:unnamed protein product [Amoebophrya sp. A120]|nr:unnamed protein product [Amoebophrya sp. A120]|eukprot:GSA120T00025429001.1